MYEGGKGGRRGPPKNALIALFSAEVRPTCGEIPRNFPAVQIIINQIYPQTDYQDFSDYFVQPIYHVIE